MDGALRSPDCHLGQLERWVLEGHIAKRDDYQKDDVRSRGSDLGRPPERVSQVVTPHYELSGFLLPAQLVTEGIASMRSDRP